MKIEERVSNYTDENGVEHKYTEIVQVNEDGTEVIRATIDKEIAEEPEPVYQPTNAEIMAEVQKSQEEIAQAAVDAYTLELMEGGII